MKVRIDKSGWLHGIRKGKSKAFSCPLMGMTVDGDTSSCGDWCPFFVDNLAIKPGDKREPIVELRCREKERIFYVIQDDREEVTDE